MRESEEGRESERNEEKHAGKREGGKAGRRHYVTHFCGDVSRCVLILDRELVTDEYYQSFLQE